MQPKSFAVASVAAIAAALSLSITYFIDVPMRMDGAWYAYPGYALSQGGDPSENIPGFALPGSIPERLVAKFQWELRSNLMVPITAAWFKIFGPSWVSLRLLGGVQMVALVCLVGVVVWRLTDDRALSVFAACMTMTDSSVISAAFSDARPDLPIAVVSVGLLALLVEARKTGSIAAALGSLVLACLLPLMHTTAAIAIAFFVALSVGIRLLARQEPEAQWVGSSLPSILPALMILCFLLRQPILDILIPTAAPEGVEAAVRIDLIQKLRGIAEAGFGAKVSMEWSRWMSYFFYNNAAHVVLLVCGCIAAPSLLKNRRSDQSGKIGLSLIVACAFAAMVVFVVDPHRADSHILVLAVMVCIASTVILSAARKRSALTSSQLAVICTSILAGATILKIGHSYSIFSRIVVPGTTNAAFEASLLSAIPVGRDVRIVGPVEVWPFLTARKQRITLLDTDRSVAPTDRTGSDFQGAEFLIVNEDHIGYGWDAAISAWSREDSIRKVFEVGNCGVTARCLAMYSLVPANDNE